MPTPNPHGVHSSPGKRGYQHDRHVVQSINSGHTTIYAVADGHGPHDTGHIVSQHIVHSLLSTLQSHQVISNHHDKPFDSAKINQAILTIDEQCIEITSKHRLYAGSTLCCVVRHQDRLLSANVGDSRAILVSCPPLVSKPQTKQITRDHVCNDAYERSRIERAGGVVVDGLLNGYISMSRALGDEDLKAHRNQTPFPVPGIHSTYSSDLFTAHPDINELPISDHDLCVVIASDGVWNTLDNQTVTTIICKSLLNGSSPSEAAQAVVDRALSKGCHDNATVIVGLLVSLPIAISLICQTSLRPKKGRRFVDGFSNHSASPRAITDYHMDSPSSFTAKKSQSSFVSSSTSSHPLASSSAAVSTTSSNAEVAIPPSPSETPAPSQIFSGPPTTLYLPQRQVKDRKFRFTRRKRYHPSQDVSWHGRSSPYQVLSDNNAEDASKSKPHTLKKRIAERIRSSHWPPFKKFIFWQCKFIALIWFQTSHALIISPLLFRWFSLWAVVHPSNGDFYFIFGFKKNVAESALANWRN